MLSVNRFVLFSMGCLLMFQSGCIIGNVGVPGSGTIISESRDVPSFDAIELSGAGHLVITNDDSCNVTVTTDDNLMELVETYIEGSTLIIRQTEPINPSDELLVEISMPSLRALDCSGAGKMELVDFETEALDIGVSGACSISGMGQTEDLAVSISGAGSADLMDFLAKRAKVVLSGAGSAKVYASEALEAEVNGVGSVKCYGNPPDVAKSVSGVGTVRIMD